MGAECPQLVALPHSTQLDARQNAAIRTFVMPRLGSPTQSPRSSNHWQGQVRIANTKPQARLPGEPQNQDAARAHGVERTTPTKDLARTARGQVRNNCTLPNEGVSRLRGPGPMTLNAPPIAETPLVTTPPNAKVQVSCDGPSPALWDMPLDADQAPSARADLTLLQNHPRTKVTQTTPATPAGRMRRTLTPPAVTTIATAEHASNASSHFGTHRSGSNLIAQTVRVPNAVALKSTAEPASLRSTPVAEHSLAHPLHTTTAGPNDTRWRLSL